MVVNLFTGNCHFDKDETASLKLSILQQCTSGYPSHVTIVCSVFMFMLLSSFVSSQTCEVLLFVGHVNYTQPHPQTHACTHKRKSFK